MTEKEKGLVGAYLNWQKLSGLRSWQRIRSWLPVFFEWLRESELDWREVGLHKAQDFQTYLATKEKDGMVHYASRSVTGIIDTVKGFYRWAVDQGMVVSNPFLKIRRIKVEKTLPRYVPSLEEMSEQLDGIGRFWESGNLGDQRGRYKVHVVAEFLYATGMRIAELTKVEESDIDWVRGTVRIRNGKGSVERTAYLNEYAREVLRTYIDEMRELLNRSKTVRGIFGLAYTECATAVLNPWFKKTFGMTSHGFRHSVGTHLLKCGCDLRFIQMILGHEDLKTTSLYTKVSKETLRDQLDEYHPRR